jgi:DNA-binding winged helix-turn-helix (wHTH) protein
MTDSIILAKEPDFRLGVLSVAPAKRQVANGAVVETLQPRIMQVLVALASCRGEVVSRDELMVRCWGGCAVSDDSIHRCVARLRRLAERHGGFRLETVPRVGYQLIEIAPPTAKRLQQVALIAASVTAGLALVAAGVVGAHLI